MRYPRYPVYKDSDVEWIGKVPEHWESRKLKHISSVEFSNVDKHSRDEEEPVRLCNYVDVYYNDYITSDLDLMEATASSDEIRDYTLRESDIIITKDSETWNDIAVPAYVPSDLNGVLCGYHLAMIRPNSKVVDGKYLFRSFSARGINDQFRVAATGITRYGLGKYWLENSLFPIPPLSEQRAIAAFLDRETAKIDALVRKQERLIELLEEKRVALISHTVTKGLDPDVEMKETGIEWLGEIPVHWEIRRLRYACEANPTKSEISHLPPDMAVSFLPMEAIGEDGTYSLKEERSIGQVLQGYTYFRDGDIGIAKITPCFENGKGALFDGLKNGLGFGTTELHILRAKKETNSRFLFYLTRSHLFRRLGIARMYGAAGQKRVPEDFVRDFETGFPSLPEQRAIAVYLDRETARIDALIDKAEAMIERLQEYRTALISAAVTGKIDVRGMI